MAKRPKTQKRASKTKGGKASGKKAVKKAAKKPVKKAAKRAVSKKPSAKKSSARMVVITLPQHITLDLPPVLHDRLKGLSQMMALPMEAVIRQALTEFADTWEEHHSTMAALADDSDRMQLVVKDE